MTNAPDKPRRRADGPSARRRAAAASAATASSSEGADLVEREVVLRKGGGDVLLLACGALAREILAVIDANGWRHLDLHCLPAILHNRPEQIPDRLRALVRAGRAAGYRDIKIVYADCGTGGLLDQLCAEEGVDRIPGPHCYSFFEGNAIFAARAEGESEIGAFYLTDFLARHFDALVWRGMGLDRHPDLRDMYFQNYDRLVYLAQTTDPALDAAAMAAAARLNLGYERRETGYGDLASFLSAAADGTLASRPAER